MSTKLYMSSMDMKGYESRSLWLLAIVLRLNKAKALASKMRGWQRSPPFSLFHRTITPVGMAALYGDSTAKACVRPREALEATPQTARRAAFLLIYL